MKAKLYVIGCAGVPARYGGFETFAENLARYLSDFIHVFIACSKHIYTTEEQNKSQKYFTPYYIGNKANGLSSLIYDFRALYYAFRHSGPEDYLLLLGVGTGIFLPFFKLFYSRKLLIHVDGLEWKRAKWNFTAKFFLKLSHRISSHYASKIIIDNEALMQYIPVRFMFKTKLISYGGDHITESTPLPAPEELEYALLIARAEPENNLDLILNTFSKLKGKKLIVISNFRDTRYGKKLLARYSDSDSIHFVDAFYDKPELLMAYRFHCKLYFHGHSAGGTNPSLIEAMWCGAAVIAWDNKFNRISSNKAALYFRDQTGLKKHISDIYNNKHVQLGKTLKEYARKKYLWKKVADDFRSLL